MDLTIYLWIAFVIIFVLVVYCCQYCKRFHREAAKESNGNQIQSRNRSNSDHDFGYWAHGWPQKDLTDTSFTDNDHHNGETFDYHHNCSHHGNETGQTGECGIHHM